jgi:ATP/maltotriose-dependent transcriptional regulator MalT
VARLTADPLAPARAALARADWEGAHGAATAACVEGADAVTAAERDVLLADASWWLGRLDDCIARREAAYHAFVDLGDTRRAGQCAVWLYEHHCFKAQPAMAGGWLRRARRALGGDEGCVEHGALVLREAEAAHGRGDLEEAAARARETIDLARALDSPDLEAESLQTLARVLVDQGRVAEGLAHYDEAMLLAVEGTLGPYATGKVYCSLISACEQVGDLSRAAEWTDATARWAGDHPFAIFPGICRVHRASALTWRGELARAEQEADRACAELVDLHVPNAAAAFAEVGDIRRRLGDLDGAEVAFARALELCGRSCAGLALLRLAQGRVDAAQRVIEGCLVDAAWSRLGRARVLPAHAQISIAAGALDAALPSADELEATAAAFDTAVLRATALATRGRVLLAQRDALAAASRLRDALDEWNALHVPYEIATTTTLLGQALRAGGDEEGAAAAFATAEALFDRIGARLEARLTRDSRVVAASHPARPAGLTEREVEVLQLVAAGYPNKEIAAELVLSEKTVSRHLSNIFTKIGVSSRAAATAFAFRHDLVGGR